MNLTASGTPCVIGVDVGTTSLKLVICDAGARVLAEASARYAIETRDGGQVTQDSEAWWQALEDCLARAGHACDLGAARAMVLSCQGETLVCCDETGEALAPALSWMDGRAGAEARQLQEERTDWYRRAGKVVNAFSTLAKILWLKRHAPDLHGRTRRFCQVADYMIARLTGRWICDVSNAAFTNYFDVRSRQWDAEICERYGLAGRLPETAESGSVAGTIRPGLARRWGLDPNLAIVLGGHDQACAALGCMAPAERDVVLSTGTAWVLYRPLDRPLFDPRGRMIMYCHAFPGQWTWLAAYSGGGALDAIVNGFCRKEREEAEAGGASVYDALLRPEFLSDELIVLPYVYGAGMPENDPAARAAIFGLGMRHAAGHLVTALAAGIAFETRRNLEYLRGLGVEVARLRMMGGAGRGVCWPQLVADACGVAVDALARADAAPLGAAYLAGRASGFWDDKGLPAYSACRRVEPESSGRRRLERMYGNYLRAVELERNRRCAVAAISSAATVLNESPNGG